MLAWLWIACSLGPRPEACTVNADCRDAFGIGSVCGTEGYCEPLAVEPRCATTYPSDLFRKPENYRDSLILGTIFNAPFDEKQQLSAELAIRSVRDAEDDDQTFGQDVAIVHCDNAEDFDYDNLSTVEAAAASARFLSDALGVQAIIGPSTSDEAFAVFDAASPNGAITISPSATSPTLTTLGGTPTEDSPGLVWRTVPPDDLQALAITTDLVDRGVATIYILHQESSYASSLAAAVEASFTSAGGSVQVDAYANITGLAAQTGTAFRSTAEEIVFFSSETSEVVEFLDVASRAPESVGRPIFLADAAADALLFDAIDGAQLFANIRGSRPAVPQGELFRVFSDTYFAVYDDLPDDSVFTSYTFDAAWLALYGSIAARSEPELTGEGIGRGILRLTSGDTLNIGYTSLGAVRAALEAGRSVDIEGSSGSLDYDPSTGEVSNPVEIWVIDGEEETFTPVRICVPDGGCSDL